MYGIEWGTSTRIGDGTLEALFLCGQGIQVVQRVFPLSKRDWPSATKRLIKQCPLKVLVPKEYCQQYHLNMK